MLTKGSSGEDCAEFLMNATIMLESHANSAKYTALVQHFNKAARVKHEKMGFYEGWRSVHQRVEINRKM
jgi:hypothetical protein